MVEMKWYDSVAYLALVAGGINWAAVEFFNKNFVDMLPGMFPKVVYGLVGIAAVYGIITFFNLRK